MGLLWTMCHFGVLTVLPVFLDDQGWDARAIGFALGIAGVAQVCVRAVASAPPRLHPDRRGGAARAP